ncbi:MAG: hypothetical protein ABH813_02630 [Patescibacteria group bacterium]
MENLTKKIRQNILKASYEAGACHIGSALSCVEILAVLYSKILKKEDIFFACSFPHRAILFGCATII